jgi:hypothetical protein
MFSPGVVFFKRHAQELADQEARFKAMLGQLLADASRSRAEYAELQRRLQALTNDGQPAAA